MALLSISTGGLVSNLSLVEFTTANTPINIVSTITRPGSDAHSLHVTTTSNGFVRNVNFTTNQTTVGYIGVAIYIASSVNASAQMVRWSTTGNVSVGNITLTTSNTLLLLNSAGAQIGSASAALSLNTWYYVELKNDASTNPGTLEARLNGVVFASGSNSNQGSWARSLVGIITGAQTSVDFYFTDIKVNDSTGSAYNSYPGTGNVKIVRPTGAGDSTAWTIAGSSPAATNWQSVSEVPPNDAVTLVNEALLSDVDMYAVGSSGIHSYDTVNAVAVGVRFNNDTADAVSSFQIQIEKTTGGTKQTSSSIVPNSTSWSTNVIASNGGINYPLVAYNDPDGSPWTSTTLGTMQIGMVSGTVGVNKVQVTNIWAYIDYTPGTPPSSTNGSFFLNFL